MSAMNPKVDGFLRKEKKWREELGALRRIVLGCGLREEVKWRQPCYMDGERNVVLIHGFKDYCALLFFKGALLKDERGILRKPGENTNAGRRIEFTSVGEIVKMEGVLKAYIREAIAVERAGLKVGLKQGAGPAMPEEFQEKLDEDAGLRAAFEALTPGRRRAYLLYFSGAKQAATRERRVGKCLGRILGGKGLEDG